MDIDKIQAEVLRDFDFNKVHKIMTLLNWTWVQYNGNRIPTVDELKLFALALVRQTVQEAKKIKQSAALSSGGFFASVAGNDIELKFVLESCLIGSD